MVFVSTTQQELHLGNLNRRAATGMLLAHSSESDTQHATVNPGMEQTTWGYSHLCDDCDITVAACDTLPSLKTPAQSPIHEADACSQQQPPQQSEEDHRAGVRRQQLSWAQLGEVPRTRAHALAPLGAAGRLHSQHGIGPCCFPQGCPGSGGCGGQAETGISTHHESPSFSFLCPSHAQLLRQAQNATPGMHVSLTQ